MPRCRAYLFCREGANPVICAHKKIHIAVDYIQTSQLLLIIKERI